MTLRTIYLRLRRLVRPSVRWALRRESSDALRYTLADTFASFVYPKLTYTEFGRIWLDDDAFLQSYRQFEADNPHSADRKYFLRSLLSLVADLPGDTAECGVFQGASSWFIAERLRSAGKTHHLFDSFEGLSAPGKDDGVYWKQGSMAASEQHVRERLHSFSVEFHQGWIPSRFGDVADSRFCFVHIDVDLYRPTFDTLSFFYPRMVPGGVILSDDYGFVTCPGAKKAWDNYLSDKPEHTVHVPTGQAFIIKQP